MSTKNPGAKLIPDSELPFARKREQGKATLCTSSQGMLSANLPDAPPAPAAEGKLCQQHGAAGSFG